MSTPINYANPNLEPRRSPWKSLLGWLLFVGLAIMFFMLMRQGRTNVPAASFGQFRSDLEAANVRSVVISPDELEYTVTVQGTALAAPTNRVRLAQDMGKNWEFIQWVSMGRQGAPPDVQIDNRQNVIINVLLPLIPWLLIFGFIWFFVFRPLRRGTPTNVQQPVPVVIVSAEAPRS